MLFGRVQNIDFHYIIDKINGRLIGMKMNLLRRSGPITSPKSVVIAIPINTMQNLWLPSGIYDNIDVIVCSL